MLDRAAPLRRDRHIAFELPPMNSTADAVQAAAIIIRTAHKAGGLISMLSPHLKLVAPSIENRTVSTPRRKPNAELRSREYLTDAEVAKLTEAAKGNRYGHRDATVILVAYRHGLR